MIAAGVDIGSLSAKAVLLNVDRGQILGYSIMPTGASSRDVAERVLAEAARRAGVDVGKVGRVVATGYGRIAVPFADRKVTEITCHARGAYHLFPRTRTVIDIGGQDSKVIRIGKDGRVVDFVMNDKCAAGTGRFLEVMARALEVNLEDMGRLSGLARERLAISSMCTVFAESEVISLIAEGRPKEDIIRGLHDAVSERVAGMAERVGLEDSITMTGGVAKNDGVVRSLEERLGVKISRPEEPQIVGALGAALIAADG
ncbi:MAG: 2-hydroxyglutaryl-CoA dehydratase [Firmicutes bacterium]|nr:2-hydroxyglutaryl-CoA dehydratase [Bacillota bacterium]